MQHCKKQGIFVPLCKPSEVLPVLETIDVFNLKTVWDNVCHRSKQKVFNHDFWVLVFIVISCFSFFADTFKSHNGPGTVNNFQNCEYYALFFFIAVFFFLLQNSSVVQVFLVFQTVDFSATTSAWKDTQKQKSLGRGSSGSAGSAAMGLIQMDFSK